MQAGETLTRLFHLTIMKECFTCKEKKPVFEFHKRAASGDGLTYNCKACIIKERANAYINRYTSNKVEDLPNEIWKSIPNNESYCVSNLGRFKRIYYKKHKKIKTKTERLHILPINSAGYCNVTISSKSYSLHRFMALMFIPNPDNLPFVNHINGIKTDNRLENLEWVSCSENTSHFKRTIEKSSKYTGVFWEANCNKWRAAIHNQHLKKRVHLGLFLTEEEASLAYQIEAKRIGKINKYMQRYE